MRGTMPVPERPRRRKNFRDHFQRIWLALPVRSCLINGEPLCAFDLFELEGLARRQSQRRPSGPLFSTLRVCSKRLRRGQN
jgi:hypothetical protein